MIPQSEWNFIFLIYADLRVSATTRNSDSWKFELLKATLAGLKIPQGCNLFFIRNEIVLNNKIDKEELLDTFICEYSDNGKIRILVPSETVKEMNEKPRRIGYCLQKIDQDFKSNKTVLFTWDHGNVFGINKLTKKIREIIGDKAKEDDVFPKASFYINPLFYKRGVPLDKDAFLGNLLLEDPQKRSPTISRIIGKERIKQFDGPVTPVIDMLTNEMLAKGLELGGFNSEHKLDVLCMMNCCMQNLHTQYALKDTVDYLVAPVTWIYFPGYDYATIFNEIDKDPTIKGKELSNLIVSTCKKDLQKPKPVVEKGPIQAIYAVSLKNTQPIVNLLKKNILQELNDAKSDIRHKYWLDTTINGNSYQEYELTDITNYRLIDLLQYFLYRLKRPYSAQQQKICKSICDSYVQNTEDKCIGAKVKKIDGQEISGIALSVPCKIDYLNPNEIFVQLFYKKASPYRSSLIGALEIDDFLDYIYKN